MIDVAVEDATMTTTVNVHEAKTQLSQLLLCVSMGEEVAQSQLEQLPILTIDPQIAQYSVTVIW